METVKLTKKHKMIIVAIAICVAIAIVIIVINFTRMKQSIMGAVTNNYFSDRELYASATAKKYGIDNTPTPEVWQNLYALRDNVLNPAREAYGSCIFVNCAYRSPQVNKLVGGVATSQHVTGQAADITTKSVEGNRKLFALLMEQGNFDQIIWEGQGAWIHVSFSMNGNRHMALAQNASGKGYTNIAQNWQTAIA